MPNENTNVMQPKNPPQRRGLLTAVHTMPSLLAVMLLFLMLGGRLHRLFAFRGRKSVGRERVVDAHRSVLVRGLFKLDTRQLLSPFTAVQPSQRSQSSPADLSLDQQGDLPLVALQVHIGPSSNSPLPWA